MNYKIKKASFIPFYKCTHFYLTDHVPIDNVKVIHRHKTFLKFINLKFYRYFSISCLNVNRNLPLNNLSLVKG